MILLIFSSDLKCEMLKSFCSGRATSTDASRANEKEAGEELVVENSQGRTAERAGRQRDTRRGRKGATLSRSNDRTSPSTHTHIYIYIRTYVRTQKERRMAGTAITRVVPVKQQMQLRGRGVRSVGVVAKRGTAHPIFRAERRIGAEGDFFLVGMWR